MNFDNLNASPTEKDAFSMAEVFGMLIFDTVFYFILTWCVL